MLPDEPTDEERKEQLDQDYDTPFRPASPINDDDDLDDTHPSTDTNIDPQELYDEGISGAAEASEPNAGDTVVGYEESQ